MSVICFYTSCLSTSLFNYKTKQQVIINARTHPVQIDDKELQNLHVTRETAKKIVVLLLSGVFYVPTFRNILLHHKWWCKQEDGPDSAFRNVCT